MGNPILLVRLFFLFFWADNQPRRVVKEGGLETLLQVALIVAIGACISNFVCMTLWSQSAKKNLQVNMTKTLDSFSTILSLLTSTFLLEDESYQPSQEKISKAVAAHQATFTGLKKSLAEAQSERLYAGHNAGRGGDPYEDAVDSLTRLAQHLNGLRSGTSLQYDLVKAHRDAKVTVAIRRHSTHGGGGGVNKNAHALENAELAKGKMTSDGPGNAENVMLRAAAAMFGDLVGELDSPLRALSVSPDVSYTFSSTCVFYASRVFLFFFFFLLINHFHFHCHLVLAVITVSTDTNPRVI